MKLLDSKGRLFAKVSILDLGAAFIIFLVIIGIFIVPGKSGVSTIAQASKKPIEVDVIVRGLGVRNPESLIQQFENAKKTNIVIRNQPAGEVYVKDIQPLPRTTVVPQPDGSVKALPDPRPEVVFFKDMILTLGGEAYITETGAVLGNQKVKIGTLIELEGKDYNFNTSTIDVRILN
ncbi:MAG: DUF4330 domain-containing protein [cyanobacterium endosymbiont of Rhopalodia yunnanensis]